MLPENYYAQKKIFAAGFTFCGGFVDTYTYLLRGHTLSAGQTGNVVFFSSSIANGNISSAITRGTTIIAFIIGLFLVTLIHSKTKSKYWKAIEIIPLILITLVVGFLPSQIPNVLIVPFLSMGMALQSGAFMKIEGKGYSNVFTSGNLRKAVLAWSQLYLLDDETVRANAIDYFLIVLSFIGGAIVSAFLQRFLGIKTIWLASCILLVINSSYVYLVFNDYSTMKK